MPHIDNAMVGQFLTPFFVWLFFIFGLIALAVGGRLVVCGNRAIRFFSLMNRWISTRHGFNRRWIGVLFIAGGAFPLFRLVRRLHETGFDPILGRAIQNPVIASGVEAALWFLIIGNLLAIAVGTMLLFSPGALESIGASVGRKYALHQPKDTKERMYLTLDHLVEPFPRLAGGIIAVGALVVMLQFGMVLFGTF